MILVTGHTLALNIHANVAILTRRDVGKFGGKRRSAGRVPEFDLGRLVLLSHGGHFVRDARQIELVEKVRLT